MERKQDDLAARPGFLRREWFRILISAFPALVFGAFVPSVLLTYYSCWFTEDRTSLWWGGPTDCVGHSWVAIVVAYVLAWPGIVTQIGVRWLQEWVAERIGVWPRIPDMVSLAMLWVYYYFLVRLGESIEMRIRRRLAGRRSSTGISRR